MSRTDKNDIREGLVATLAARYLAALLAGDRERAAGAVADGLAAGLDATTLLVDVLGASQRELGHLWSLGRLSIAHEHRATEITREAIERVRQARRPARRLGLSAVVCAAPGESHSLAARVVATLLLCQGWEVELLGEAPPGDGLVAHIAHGRPALVALSATLPASLERVEALCLALRALSPRPLLLVGGAATAGLAPDALGADLVTADAATGLAFAAALAAPPPPPDLPAYLALVGGRIHEARLAAGLSQAGLAARAGLTRPYVGAIERGRQNITLEAALRLAGALGLSTTALLAQEPS